MGDPAGTADAMESVRYKALLLSPRPGSPDKEKFTLEILYNSPPPTFVA